MSYVDVLIVEERIHHGLCFGGSGAVSYVDFLIVEEKINFGLCFGKQYYYFGKHW